MLSSVMHEKRFITSGPDLHKNLMQLFLLPDDASHEI